MSIVITVAPTGPIATKADNPALPTSPEEIATAVEQAYHAGAAVAHIHLATKTKGPQRIRTSRAGPWTSSASGVRS